MADASASAGAEGRGEEAGKGKGEEELTARGEAQVPLPSARPGARRRVSFASADEVCVCVVYAAVSVLPQLPPRQECVLVVAEG